MNVSSFTSRPVICGAVILCCGIGLAQALKADTPSHSAPGFIRQATRPQGIEHCVKYDGGWMVPYDETIPGTSVRFTMIPIPGRELTEGPQFIVEVPPFWMGRCEVTWGEYRTYMDALWVFLERSGEDPQTPAAFGADAVTAPSFLYEPEFVNARVEANRPATGMSQYAARQYTKWISKLIGRFYRIPSESEWEYACRAGTTTPWHSGARSESLEDVAWYVGNAREKTHPVGQKRANAWGLHDMHGNVAEWVMDEVVAEGYARQAAVPEPVHIRDAIQWPMRLEPRAVRGGAFYDEPSECRSAARRQSKDRKWNELDANIPPSPHWFMEGEPCGLGFRIVRPLDCPLAAEQERWWEADVESVKKAVNFYTQDGRTWAGAADKSAARELEAILEERKKMKGSGTPTPEP
jgi:formylglycine-generating enzyme required for sulfatase activity